MYMLIVIGLVFSLSLVLFILGWAHSSHSIRYRDGYDSELETDYQEMLKYLGK